MTFARLCQTNASASSPEQSMATPANAVRLTGTYLSTVIQSWTFN